MKRSILGRGWHGAGAMALCARTGHQRTPPATVGSITRVFAIFAAVKRSLLLLLLLPVMAAAAAQYTPPDRIDLMNGQVIPGRVLGQSTLEVRYELLKGHRWVERAEPTESVFSVTDSLGHERIWYFMDTVFGNDLSIPQMRWFMNGERDARKGYKPWVPMVGGFVLGAGMVIALDLEVNSLIIPPAYAGIMAWPRVNVTRGSITDPTMEGDPYYAMGYSAVGRPKRVVRSLIASALGVGVGLFVRQVLINPNRPSGY